MQDCIEASELRAGERRIVGDVSPQDLYIRQARGHLGTWVLKHHYFVSRGAQAPDQVRPDEAEPAGDQNTLHAVPPCVQNFLVASMKRVITSMGPTVMVA